MNVAPPASPSSATKTMYPDQSWIESLKFNQNGLIPAIAQDHRDGAVLMLAWMNQETIHQTLASGEAHYW